MRHVPQFHPFPGAQELQPSSGTLELSCKMLKNNDLRLDVRHFDQ